MNPIPTVGILIIKDNKVLLVRHGEQAGHPTGSYGIPAGRLQDDETAKHAAVRELFEETGLVTTEDDLEEIPLSIPPADLPRKDGTVKRFTITLFSCKKFTGELRASDETIPEWVAVDQLDGLDLIGYTKRMVEEGKKYVLSN